MGTVAIVNLIMIALPVVSGLVGGIIGATAWGKKHKSALDQVTAAIGVVKQNQGTIDDFLNEMTKRETTAKPNVVMTWKKSVDKTDPKGE